MDHEEVSGNRATLGGAVGLKPRFEKKLKGHESFIKALEFNRVQVEITCVDSDTAIGGTIKHSDKYTISLIEPGSDKIKLIFKSAIKFIDAPLAPARSPGRSTRSEEGHY